MAHVRGAPRAAMVDNIFGGFLPGDGLARGHATGMSITGTGTLRWGKN